MSGNHPYRQAPMGTVTLKEYQWKKTTVKGVGRG